MYCFIELLENFSEADPRIFQLKISDNTFHITNRHALKDYILIHSLNEYKERRERAGRLQKNLRIEEEDAIASRQGVRGKGQGAIYFITSIFITLNSLFLFAKN